MSVSTGVSVSPYLPAGCPYCSHRRFGDLSLAALYPDMAKDWDFDKNGESLRPDMISPNSEKQVWWKCEHGVEWKQGIAYRKRSYLHGTFCFSLLTGRIPSLFDLSAKTTEDSWTHRRHREINAIIACLFIYSLAQSRGIPLCLDSDASLTNTKAETE